MSVCGFSLIVWPADQGVGGAHNANKVSIYMQIYTQIFKFIFIPNNLIMV